MVPAQVAFDFAVDLGRLSRPGIITAVPSSGKVAAGEKARIRLKVGLEPTLVGSVVVRVRGVRPPVDCQP